VRQAQRARETSLGGADAPVLVERLQHTELTLAL
jgi:hypothetical protein